MKSIYQKRFVLFHKKKLSGIVKIPHLSFLNNCSVCIPTDFQEPYAVVVLLEKDLVVIDLAQIG